MQFIQLDELFSFKGRIGRWRFLLANICITLFSFLCTTVLYGIGTALEKTPGDNLILNVLALLLAVAMMIVTFWAVFAVEVKRLHDCNLSGYWVFAIIAWGLFFYSIDIALSQGPQIALSAALFLLIAQWLPFLLLLFVPGTKSENGFGMIPSK